MHLRQVEDLGLAQRPEWKLRTGTPEELFTELPTEDEQELAALCWRASVWGFRG